MTSKLVAKLEKTLDHSRAKRNAFASYIIAHPDQLPALIAICKQVDTPISCKAAWALEYVCGKQLHIILPQIDDFLSCAKVVYQDPAVRPMAKICEHLILAYYKKKDQKVISSLTDTRKELITDLCFDWLISNQKVAAQAYSMTSLYLLGKDFDWIHPELKMILLQNYKNGSTAYKARARMVLNKI